MDAPVNEAEDNVAIRSASVIRVLLGSEISSVDASRPNTVHPFPFSGFPAYHCTGTTGARPRPPDSNRRRRAPSRLLFRAAFRMCIRRKALGSGAHLLVQGGFLVQRRTTR